MKGFCFFNKAFAVACITLGIFVLGGCSYLFQKPYKPSKPFPAKIPETSKYSVAYNARGEFFIADRKGESLPAEKIPLSVLLKSSDMTRSDWLTVLGSFKLYQVKYDNSVWLCNEGFQCYKGEVKDDEKSAVLSLNYDGKRLFISDADGRLVTPKDLKAFAALVKEANLDKKLGIKELSTFTIYKIIGSIKVADCVWGRCLCTCIHSNGTRTPCVNGQCPD
ncbi:MAG: hypothetical protein P8X96_11805 [Desulfobacteraceae bacterium]